MWNQRKASQASSSSSRTGSRSTSRSSTHASMRGSAPKELEFQFFIRQTETFYPPWWTRSGVISWYRDLPDDTLWNCYICVFVLLGVVWTVCEYSAIYLDIIDVIYNVSYAIHIFAIGYKIVTELENTDITFWTVLAFLVDLVSFAHYGQGQNPFFKLCCYYVRLHRPFRYLWSLSDYNLKGSILGTTLKFVYIFLVLRISWAYGWMHVDAIAELYYNTPMSTRRSQSLTGSSTTDTPGSRFLRSVYIINKMFIPIGPTVYPSNDVERLLCLMVMITGCLVVTGAAVASLSLIISLYMRPEETFRSRYRLIMKEMKDTHVPGSLRDKVETFYKMYWHKQRAVSETQLLPTFPPTLPATINADIYFESTQKSRILRDLSLQMLSELAKSMETIHYIPGDAILKRGTKKCKIIYITYGDIEMLTAEDDTTAILRMTRGTVLTPCGGAISTALGLSHLAVRAATFCTAHVLTAPTLWRIVNKHSVTQDHAGPILASFTDHIEKVKRHYCMKPLVGAVHKSSILQFNRNLMALKMMKDVNGDALLASTDVFLEIAGCYIMRNRPDSTLTDQSDEICLRPTFPCILQPTSSLLVAWHCFVALLILMICVMHPYCLVFKKTVPVEFRFFDYIMSFVFVVDHIVHLSTGANVEEGVPITFTQTSSQQMRSHWFVLDVVATLPIFEFIGDGHFAGLNKILRLPKFFRVLKEMEEMWVYRGNILRFLSYTMLLLIACYLIASVQQSFMCFQSGYCLVTNLTHAPFWGPAPLDVETVGARLWFGLYWSISMITFTFHRETWGKEHWKNVLYTLVILEICIVLRIFMEAVYSATIMVTTALREDYGDRINMVKSFLIRNEVDPELRKRFIEYLQLCWHTDKAYKMTHKKHSTIFYDLPPHVFQDIVGRNRSKYMLVIPFMKLVNKEDLRTVSSAAQLFYTSPNEILLNTGELTNEMYVIKQGICEILCPITHNVIAQLSSKNHFGALICLLRLPAYYTIRAVTHVQVFSISRKRLLSALETPHIKQALAFLRTQPEFHRLQTRIPSFVKYTPPPPTPNMMHFRLPRKHEPDSEFLNPFSRLGFLSILRYVFPRYTIRPDGAYLRRYEIFRVMCALMSSQIFPHYTYLVLQWPFLYYVTFILDLSAWYDIFQRMLVGHFNEQGILIYHPSSTAAYYMKGAFLVDLFGCLSLENLEGSRKESSGGRFRVTPMRQFLMLNRLLQLYRWPSATMMFKQHIERRDIVMVIKAIPLFMAMLNVLTCLMVFYSVNIYFSQDKYGRYDWRLEPFDDQGGSWVYLFRNSFRFNLTATPWNLHVATYFWVVYECSSTGYGMFNPSNHDIMKILFVGMASSTMIVTYFSVRIISMRANVNKSLAGFQQHMKDINVYMAREKLDDTLQKEIRRFYEYNWEKMGGIDYRGVLKLCDQITLRTDAILHIYGPTFTKCPLLSTSDVSVLRIVGRAVRCVYFLRDMKLIELDDMVTHAYFVDYGGVEIRVAVGEMTSILRLPRGSVFGNLENVPGHRSPYNVTATARLRLLMIKSVAFSNIMNDFPTIKELLDKYRGPDKKGYILGGEAQVKMRRHVPPPMQHSQKDFVKYIYFQEGLIQIYLIFVCMACIYLDLYNAGFEDNRRWLIMTLYILDFCFLWKILTQHSLPLLVTKKNIKKLMMPIRKMYFKTEFRYDFISIFPIELLSYVVTTHSWTVFSWLRLNRTFRIATVHKCLTKRNEKITVNLTMTTIMALFIWFTLFVHTCTCVWYFIGRMEDSISPNSSWYHQRPGAVQCENHYICSMYFIITTFTQNGVGDIMPKKQSEVMFVSALQIISTMVFMMYVGEFSNILQFQSFRSFSFYSKYLELQEFLKNNRVSKNLVTIVNKYTLHLWRETRGLQMPTFLKNAPLSLRLRIMSAAYLHHITRHHIFEECEPAFLRQLVGCLQLYTYNEGMFVVKESEITDAMYVIHTGKVKETCEDMDISARVYPAGSYFGIGLLRNTPYTHSYETMIKSQVLTLRLDDWEYLLKHFPESRSAIHKHMKQVGDKDMDQSNWPGGIPEPVPSTIFEPPADATDQDFGQVSQFPGTERHFGRRSTVDEGAPVMPPSSLRRQSQFAWPTDSRNIGEGVSTERREEKRGEDTEHAHEVPVKLGLLGKFANTAKKLLGRVSDTDLLSSAEGRDDLLLEEDEEATEALLAQFEAAKKENERKSKKSKRKSVFQETDEEDTEKHMLTLDMNESKTDQVQQTETMRPLRMRDDQDEELSTATDTRDVLNLGRPKIKSTAKDRQGSTESVDDQQAPRKTLLQLRKTIDTPTSEESTDIKTVETPSTSIETLQASTALDTDTKADDTDTTQEIIDTNVSDETTKGNISGIQVTGEEPTDTETVPGITEGMADEETTDTGAAREATDALSDKETTETEATPGVTDGMPDEETTDTGAARRTMDDTPDKEVSDTVVATHVMPDEETRINQAPDPETIPDTQGPTEDDSMIAISAPSKSVSEVELVHLFSSTQVTEETADTQTSRAASETSQAAQVTTTAPAADSKLLSDVNLARPSITNIVKETADTTALTPQAAVQPPQAPFEQPQVAVKPPQAAVKQPEAAAEIPDAASKSPQAATQEDQAAAQTPQPTAEPSQTPSESFEASGRSGSFTRSPILFDPTLLVDDDTPGGNYSRVTQPSTQEEEPEPELESSKSMHVMDMKEEGTRTSASKLNRRFVHVRYEPENEDDEVRSYDSEAEEFAAREEAMTRESDEPTSGVDKSVGESEEGDDEATTSTSTPESTQSPKRGKPYRRDSN